jgi:hypothetical protein
MTKRTNGLAVVPLHLEIRYPAIPMGGRNLAMSQKVLDGGPRHESNP